MINFEGYKFIDGGVCAPKGFLAGAVSAGIKKDSQKRDLSIIYAKKPSIAASIYTRNKVKGAPIIVTQKNLENGIAQAVVVNSGNANTCNPNGIEIAEKISEITANSLKIDKSDVIIASTGVIGQPLEISPFEKHLPHLCANLTENGSSDACYGIMTTDTRKKEFAVEFIISGKIVRIGGICKGSGMINPNMATMLSFITTDVAINCEMLNSALRSIADKTFNCVFIDGDTSTNDMVSILSSGFAENTEITSYNKDYEVFCNGLYAVMINLAREMAKDGEGATKLIECITINAPTITIANSISKSVVGSSLVKAAIFAADANWGRILCAIGYAKGDFNVDKISVDLISKNGKVRVCENGEGVSFSEEKAYNVLVADEITISIDLNDGTERALAFGCDLTYDYVKINAEYRS